MNRNGSIDSSPKYCDGNLIDHQQVFGNHLLISFHSNQGISSRGFEVYWNGISQGKLKYFTQKNTS